jgi:hypothetical protein
MALTSNSALTTPAILLTAPAIKIAGVYTPVTQIAGAVRIVAPPVLNSTGGAMKNAGEFTVRS